ncbi:hypothetical protein LCGC14_0952210 [marine sediment metagenome]|uniref:Uncharacterized protein n=1 Tax=marine sediment metagenome TaxID=412755 RepID=A0A0F9P341_9ZZZZ
MRILKEVRSITIILISDATTIGITRSYVFGEVVRLVKILEPHVGNFP